MENTASITELERRFGIPRIAQVVAGYGGLPKVRITSPAAGGEMYLHGAHVTSWRPAPAEEVLFLSSKSRWQDGIAIRGGVPICFPWFGDKAGDPKAPAHGFVRTKSWQLDSIAHSGDAVTVSMSTGSEEGTMQWWPYDFRLNYHVTFGAELSLELEVHNIGTAPFHFEEALHAYHRVGDVRVARVKGLDGVHYLDKADKYREKVQQGEVVIASETDRVYLSTPGSLELHDPALRRRVSVAKENSLTTVVWNPWADKAKEMVDLGDNEWTRMLCIETSNVLGYAVEVAPGQKHRMKAVLRVAAL
ncbi:MAG TPA: D-hexose-6-phosphate mutarotase [Terriglobales bacterium]|jgi:D-hexose-6-phosphate mutarotase